MITIKCQMCGCVLVNVDPRTRYCNECRMVKNRQRTQQYIAQHKEQCREYRRNYYLRKGKIAKPPKWCVFCNAQLPSHTSKYCTQCRTLHRKEIIRNYSKKQYTSQQITNKIRNNRLRRLDTKIETYRHKIPVLPTIDPKSVCIAMQCDPSVQYFETEVLPKLKAVWEGKHSTIPFPKSEQDAIIAKIRAVNKVCYKKKLYPMAKVIILLALWAQYGRVATQEFLVELVDSNAVTLRMWVSRINSYFSPDLRITHKCSGKNPLLKRSGKGLYGDIP